MKKIVYMLTQDPRERTELITGALTQALDALKSGYECEIFLTDNGVKLVLPEYIAGLKTGETEPLAKLLDYYGILGGRIYACNPSLTSRNIDVEKDTSGITDFVNASKLIESTVEADAFFAY